MCMKYLLLPSPHPTSPPFRKAIYQSELLSWVVLLLILEKSNSHWRFIISQKSECRSQVCTASELWWCLLLPPARGWDCLETKNRKGMTWVIENQASCSTETVFFFNPFFVVVLKADPQGRPDRSFLSVIVVQQTQHKCWWRLDGEILPLGPNPCNGRQYFAFFKALPLFPGIPGSCLLGEPVSDCKMEGKPPHSRLHFPQN